MDLLQINNMIPYGAKYILNNFTLSGYQVFIVGGCCRDILLNRTPNDYDICTSATPDEIIKIVDILDYLDKDILLKTIPTGIKHGTITIVINGEQYETTTFRQDGNYSDGRRPDNVTFTTNITDDLSRRDFTINAIAYCLGKGFIDPFNGMTDIENKVIRCVGNPNERFNEDGLRILRAIRFAAQLGFTIEEETAKAIHNNKHLLDNISRERIQSELFKILNSNYCGNEILREYADVICQCIPEIKPMIGFEQNNPYHLYDVWEHTLHCMQHEVLNDTSHMYPADINLRLAILLHDIGKPHCYTEDGNCIGHFYGHANISAYMAEDILRNLKCSNDIINSVCELIEHHDMQFVTTKSAIKRMLNALGETQLRRLLVLRLCDISGQNPNTEFDERTEKVNKIGVILNEVIAEEECFKLKDLAINGNDLIQHGIPQGKLIGNILNELLIMVIDGEVVNEKDKLIEMTELIIKRKVDYND